MAGYEHRKFTGQVQRFLDLGKIDLLGGSESVTFAGAVVKLFSGSITEELVDPSHVLAFG